MLGAARIALRNDRLIGSLEILAGIAALLLALAFLFLVAPVLVAVALVADSVGFALVLGATTLFAVAAIPCAALAVESGSARLERRRSGLCPRCRYDLRAHASSRCPECGAFTCSL
ncbi:MAG TPA: hypothetical protein PKC43_09105 [Phycisphaerales bacterium]|nr:hypothetical protein [Phycisphaerales bacterium]HMP37593.1 hypothetical protein [Phycisphaerales bacterium]